MNIIEQMWLSACLLAYTTNQNTQLGTCRLTGKYIIIILYMYVDMSCGHLDISINSNNFMYVLIFTYLIAGNIYRRELCIHWIAWNWTKIVFDGFSIERFTHNWNFTIKLLRKNYWQNVICLFFYRTANRLNLLLW